MTSNWTVADIGDLSGRTAIVTGANTGLGLATAEVLTGAGASVVLAVRDIDKGERARASILGRHAASSDRSHDADLQRRLWAESERLTGITAPI
jgi:NAD(P)-dependent dehydrogenase (short-subunit alcohol dehydrogenase family)